MSGPSVRPGRPPVSRRRVGLVLSVVAGLILIVVLTAVIATLTAPDNGDDDTPASPPPAVITDQQATDIATTVMRSMFEVSPDTADQQVAAFKANACGDFAKDALPNLIAFTDGFKREGRSSTVEFQSVAVVPHVATSPTAEVIVASTWRAGDVVNKTRVVYQVVVQNGKTCVTKAQFL